MGSKEPADYELIRSIEPVKSFLQDGQHVNPKVEI